MEIHLFLQILNSIFLIHYRFFYNYGDYNNFSVKYNTFFKIFTVNFLAGDKENPLNYSILSAYPYFD